MSILLLINAIGIRILELRTLCKFSAVSYGVQLLNMWKMESFHAFRGKKPYIVHTYLASFRISMSICFGVVHWSQRNASMVNTKRWRDLQSSNPLAEKLAFELFEQSELRFCLLQK